MRIKVDMSSITDSLRVVECNPGTSRPSAAADAPLIASFAVGHWLRSQNTKLAMGRIVAVESTIGTTEES